MPETDPTDQQALQALYGYITQEIKAGCSNQEMIEELEEKGIDTTTAEDIVKEIRLSLNIVSRESGKRNIAIGATVCGLGTVVTLATIAASPGGFYAVFWGMIVFGAIQMLMGVGQLWGDKG